MEYQQVTKATEEEDLGMMNARKTGKVGSGISDGERRIDMIEVLLTMMGVDRTDGRKICRYGKGEQEREIKIS